MLSGKRVGSYQKHRKEIDVVVLDWGLPRLDGGAVFRQLKEINLKVTVIGISGYLDFGLRDSLLREGVRDFLQKPCTPAEIIFLPTIRNRVLVI